MIPDVIACWKAVSTKSTLVIWSLHLLLVLLIGTAMALDSATKCLYTAHKYPSDPKCEAWIDHNETVATIGMVHINCYGANWPQLKRELDLVVAVTRDNQTIRDHIDLSLFYIDFETVTWRQQPAFELPLKLIHLTIGHCTNLNLDKFKLLSRPLQLPSTIPPTDTSGGSQRQTIEHKEALGVRSLVICSTMINTSASIRPWDVILERKFPYLSRITLSHLTPQLRFTDNRWQLRNKYLDELDLDTLDMEKLPAGLFVIRETNFRVIDKVKGARFKIAIRNQPIGRVEEGFIKVEPPEWRFASLMLDLSNCTLNKRKLAKNALHFLTYIGRYIELDLRMNNLPIIDRELFESILDPVPIDGRMSRIRVQLHENPIDCYHCGNEWLAKNRPLKRQIFGVVCQPDYRDFDELHEDDFPDCSSAQSTVLTFLLVVISFLVAVAILMILFTLITFFFIGLANLPWQHSSTLSSPQQQMPQVIGGAVKLPESSLAIVKTDKTRATGQGGAPLMHDGQPAPKSNSGTSRGLTRRPALNLVAFSNSNPTSLATQRSGGVSSLLDLSGQIHVLKSTNKRPTRAKIALNSGNKQTKKNARSKSPE